MKRQPPPSLSSSPSWANQKVTRAEKKAENVPLPIDQASSRKVSRAPHGVAGEWTNQQPGPAHVASLDP
jgi:hypothetical protein